MCSPFPIKWIYLIERSCFVQKYKFSNKNDMVCAWRNFKNIFPRPISPSFLGQKYYFLSHVQFWPGRPKLSFSYIGCYFWQEFRSEFQNHQTFLIIVFDYVFTRLSITVWPFGIAVAKADGLNYYAVNLYFCFFVGHNFWIGWKTS